MMDGKGVYSLYSLKFTHITERWAGADRVLLIKQLSRRCFSTSNLAREPIKKTRDFFDLATVGSPVVVEG